MALVFATINRDTPLGGDYYQTLEAGRRFMDGMKKHSAIMNSGATNAQLADAYGVYPSTSGGTDQATQAGDIKSEQGSCQGALDTASAAILQLLAKTGH